MGWFLRWYLAVQLLGLVALLLTRPGLSRLPSGGYAVAKGLGVLMAGVGLWLGIASGLLANGRGGATLVVLGLAAAAVARARRARLRSLLLWARRRTAMIVAAEVLFLVAA